MKKTRFQRLAQVGSFLIRGIDSDWDSKTYKTEHDRLQSIYLTDMERKQLGDCNKFVMDNLNENARRYFFTK